MVDREPTDGELVQMVKKARGYLDGVRKSGKTLTRDALVDGIAAALAVENFADGTSMEFITWDARVSAAKSAIKQDIWEQKPITEAQWRHAQSIARHVESRLESALRTMQSVSQTPYSDMRGARRKIMLDRFDKELHGLLGDAERVLTDMLPNMPDD